MHIIVETPPQNPPPPAFDERPLHLLTLSARSETALRDLAGRYSQHLAAHQNLPDIAYTSHVGRFHFEHRLALSTQDAGEAARALTAFASGQPSQAYVGHEAAVPPDIAFLFTGQGALMADTGRQLYVTQPHFRETLDHCAAILGTEIGRNAAARRRATGFAGPGICPGRSLAQLGRGTCRRDGAQPGRICRRLHRRIFSLEDALQLVAVRERLMQRLAGTGAMAVVFASADRVEARLRPQVAIAAINGPENVVISGERAAVETVIEALKAERVRARWLDISMAAHNPLLESGLPEFATAMEEIVFSAPQIDFVSLVSGQFAERAPAAYWQQHLLKPVQFEQGMHTLAQAGYRHFLEIGPAPVLIEMGQRCLSENNAVWLASLRPGHGDWAQLLSSLGQLYVQGIRVDWPTLDRDYPRRRVPLPTYPYERQRFWLDAAIPKSLAQRPIAEEGLLGQRLRSPAFEGAVFQTLLSATQPAYLEHHRIFDEIILPSPAFIEMAYQAAAQCFGPDAGISIHDLSIREALILDPPRVVQSVLAPLDQGTAPFQVFSRKPDAEDWSLHVTASIRLEAAAPDAPPSLELDAVQHRCPEQIERETFYALLAALGLEFNPLFQGVQQVWCGPGEVLGEVHLPPGLSVQDFHMHPAYFDAGMHVLGGLFPISDLQAAYLITAIDHIHFYRPPGESLWSHGMLREDRGDYCIADVGFYDTAGQMLAVVEGILLRRASSESLRRQPLAGDFKDWLYQIAWDARPLSAAPQRPAFAPQPALNAALADYRQFLAALNPIIAALVVEALEALGGVFVPGTRLEPEQLAVKPPYRPLLLRLLKDLAEAGLVEESGWTVTQLPQGLPWQSALAALGSEYPAYSALIALVSRCGAALADILQGRENPVQLLFPQGSLDELRQLYQDAPFMAVFNTAVGQIVEGLAAPLRVLEIGAGTGGTTASALPTLAVKGASYVFSDVSPLFLEAARQSYGAFSGVDYRLLNIEQDPSEQGFAAGSFDVVLAANVLHATGSLKQTLDHVRQLLAPGGLLDFARRDRAAALGACHLWPD